MRLNFIHFGRTWLVAFFVLATLGNLVAQQLPATDSLKFSRDSSVKKDTVRRMRSGSPFKVSDTSVGHLIQRIETLTITLNEFNSVLKRGFDTANIVEQLPDIEQDLQFSKDNINSYGRRMNLRNLNVTRVLLSEIQRKLKNWQGQLFGYSTQLNNMNASMQEMRNDSTFQNLPDDSTLKVLYVRQIRDLGRKWRKADSINRHGLINIGLLQSRVAMQYLDVTELYDDVNFRIKNFGREMFLRDDDWIWSISPSRYPNDFGEVVQRSFTRGKSILGVYFSSSLGTTVLVILIGFGFYGWIRHNIRKIRAEKKDADEVLTVADFLPRFPVISSAVLAIVLGNFLYQHPPAVYMTVLGVVLFFFITDLLWFRWPQVLHRYWIAAGILFLVNSFFNLLIENTFLERIFILLLAIMAVAVGMGLLKSLRTGVIRYSKIARVMVILFNVTNGLSILANIGGRFALAKLLCNSSMITLFLAIGLLMVVEIVLDAVYLQTEAYQRTNQLAYHFNFKEVKEKIRNWLLLVAGVFWFVGFAKGLSFYDYFYDGIEQFFAKDRRLGNSVFSFGSVATFVLVIWVSTVISQLLSYLFGNKTQTGFAKKTRFGNWMLLARIGVLTTGILVAFAASGIPLDKIAIIIGALGVGIGFGLQNIVGNLVSGIILAFEKPVQIGDVIEVGPHSGTVKEIGFRSSKITTADGAEVIVPNSDLISQHVTNWTMTNNFRRVEVNVGVAYGSDLSMCREAIAKAVFKKNNILSIPEPLILVNELAGSSINFRILFWANDIGNWVLTKSQVLDEVYANLNQAGIRIPFPQQDLHIKSVDDEVLSALKRDGRVAADEESV